MTDKPLLVDRYMCPYCYRITAYKQVKVNQTARWMCDSCIDLRRAKGKPLKIIKVKGPAKKVGQGACIPQTGS